MDLDLSTLYEVAADISLSTCVLRGLALGPTSGYFKLGYLVVYEARCALTYPPPAIEHENGRLHLPLCMDSTPSSTKSFDKLCLANFDFK